ncbi:MAG: M23 family metallopeptidase [Candidatus Thorarchaeota archaeon]
MYYENLPNFFLLTGQPSGTILGQLYKAGKLLLSRTWEMWKDKITVMILPGDRGEVRQYAIPVRLLWTVGIFGIFFVLVNLFLLADYFDTRVDRAKLEKLTWENQHLSRQYTALEESIANLKTDYGELVAKEEAIRTIFGLPEIDPEARMLGVGGPIDPKIAEITPSTRAALEVTSDVEELIRISKFERERYREVYDQLVDKREQLNHMPSIMPTRGYISRGFGNKDDPFTGFKQFHSGLDIANRTGTPVYATADGKVVSVRVNGGLGKMVAIDHGYGFKTRYAHLDEFGVKVGQRIKRGDIVGYMGNTGYSTGPHLHYEVLKNGRSVNPYKYILNK